jgi:hypothetical protein
MCKVFQEHTNQDNPRMVFHLSIVEDTIPNAYGKIKYVDRQFGERLVGHKKLCCSEEKHENFILPTMDNRIVRTPQEKTNRDHQTMTTKRARATKKWR